MGGIIVAAALSSALLHAVWNAMVKASADPQAAMAAQVMASGLIAAPLLLVLPAPSLAALPWLAGSALFNLGTALALGRGYATGSFGLVYPTTRAVSPLLVALLATTLIGERLSTTGLAGIVLVSGGVALLVSGARTDGRRALGWALLAGTCSAAYALCDAQGSRLSASVLGYGFAASALNALMMAVVRQLRGEPVAAAIRAHGRVATGGAVFATMSYLLILYVWAHAPIAAGAALRDTSVVFASLIAWMALREPLRVRQLFAVLLTASGATVLRFM